MVDIGDRCEMLVVGYSQQYSSFKFSVGLACSSSAEGSGAVCGIQRTT